MISKVLNVLKRNSVCAGDRILVALSGGADSSVLLDVLMKISEAFPITVCAAHLNHMLRGPAADADEAFAKKKCEAYGIDFVSERVNVSERAKELGESEELAARNIRYDFLERARILTDADFIATAHNANDNLETVIYNLSRGSGLDGLCGIPHARGRIIRPLIECTRAEIERYAEERDIPFCVDGTNSSLIYSRNRIRHTVIAPLLEMNPQAAENATRATGILRVEAEFLSRAAISRAEEIEIENGKCVARELIAEPALLSRIAEIFAAKALGVESVSLEACHVAQIASLCEGASPSARINLPKGLCVKREYEKIVFFKEAERLPLGEFILSEGENFCGSFKVDVKKLEKSGKINNLLNTFYVPYDKIQGDLVVRQRAEGDEIKLSGRKTKTVKRLFIDEKVPRDERDFIPIVADGEKVFAVFGFGADERFCESCKPGYLIEIKD